MLNLEKKQQTRINQEILYKEIIMTVNDLIIELQKVKNKDLPIAVFNQSDDDRHEILLVDDNLEISVDINISTKGEE